MRESGTDCHVLQMLIIFITDVRQGLVDADSKIADMLEDPGNQLYWL